MYQPELVRKSVQMVPKMREILGVFFITFLTSLFSSFIFKQYTPEHYHSFTPFVSHIPMFIIPWLWFHFRIRKYTDGMVQWKWTKGSLRPLLLMCIWLIPLQVLGNVDVLGSPAPEWYQSGKASIMMQILFQGLVVGFSEEMFMRPCLHQALISKQLGGFHLFKRVYLSKALLITACLFGLLHMGNILSQPFGYTMLQVIYAFIIGVIFGVYYERTRNYVGTSILHNLLDFVGVAVVLVVFGL